MYCKNLSKSLNGLFKCKIRKKNIDILNCNKSCPDFNLVRNRGIKKVGPKRIFVKKEIYDKVYERDEGKCQLCGNRNNLELHHIDGRSKKLTNDINNCIILCRNCHIEVVHKNQKRYKPILKNIIKGCYYGNLEGH